MGDTIIIEDDKPKPPPDVIVVEKEAKPKVEVVMEKTTVVETRKD